MTPLTAAERHCLFHMQSARIPKVGASPTVEILLERGLIAVVDESADFRWMRITVAGREALWQATRAKR